MHSYWIRPSLRRSGYGSDLYPRATCRETSDFRLHRSSADGSAISATPTSGGVGMTSRPVIDFRSTVSGETNAPADSDGDDEVDDGWKSRGGMTSGIPDLSSSSRTGTGSSFTGGNTGQPYRALISDNGGGCSRCDHDERMGGGNAENECISTSGLVSVCPELRQPPEIVDKMDGGSGNPPR